VCITVVPDQGSAKDAEFASISQRLHLAMCTVGVATTVQLVVRNIVIITGRYLATLRHKRLEPIIIVGEQSLVLLLICMRLLLQAV